MLSPIELLTHLVRLPSINPMGRTDIPSTLIHESRVTDYLEAQLRRLGVACWRQAVAPGRDNLLAEYAPSNPPFRLLWEAHQDTVPVDGMTIDPFAAAIRDGKLYGRGSCDVKAGGAAMLAAFARLVREKPPGSAAVTLAFTVDEEHTFLGAQELVKSALAADFAVVAEPTGLNIVTAHKGVARWRIETAGRACHSSRPDAGENAVYHMARVIFEVENYAAWLAARPAHPTLGPPTLSLGRIEGGTSPNTVPDFCRIDLDRRLLPGETAAEAVADLEGWFRNEPNTNAVPFTFSPILLACPPLAPTNHSLVDALGRAIDSVAGQHERHAVPYGTDASTIAEAGIPAVVFGPGDIAQAHTKDEWVDLEQVKQASEILFRLATTQAT